MRPLPPASLRPRPASGLLIALPLLAALGCATPPPGTDEAPSAVPAPTVQADMPQAGTHTPATDSLPALKDTELTFILIEAPNGTHGYEIMSNGHLVIRQTNLPGQAGVEGARTKEDAERLATLVIDKLRRGEMPPTVHDEELRALGLIP